MTDQGCSDGNCRLRLTPVVGMHTNAGCRCLRDVPTQLKIAIVRKLVTQHDEIARLKAIVDNLEQWRSRAIQFWKTAMPDLDDDIGRRAAGDLLLWIDRQLESEHAAEKAKECE